MGDVGTRSPSIFDHEHRGAWTDWLKVRFLAAERSLVDGLMAAGSRDDPHFSSTKSSYTSSGT